MAEETTPAADETTAAEALNPIRCTNCGYNDPHGNDHCPRCNITRKMAAERVERADPPEEAETEAEAVNGTDQPKSVAQP